MANPVIEGFTSNVGGVDVQAHTANMPAGVVAGETLVLAVVSYYNGSTANDFAVPTGWTLIFQRIDAYASLEVFRKTSDGTEATVSLSTIRPTVTSFCQSYRISGVASVESATSSIQGGNASINFVTAPTLVPSWSGGTLYMFFGGAGRGNTAFSTLPAGYTTNGGVSGLNAGGRGVALASGYKAGASASESPGDLVAATYSAIIANTVAFEGVGPLVSTTDSLQPGASFTLNYSNFPAAATSPTSLTDASANVLSLPVTVINTDTGGVHAGTAVGAMAALPSSGSIIGLRFGTITAELD
jgi:hypothetical protein